MSKEKQIEEMAHDLCGRCQDGICVVDGKPCRLDLDCTCQINATTLYEAGYRKQSEGEWVYYECVSSYDGAKSGYGCSRCGAFVDENIFETDEIHKEFCGSCGAKMKGGAK